MHMFVDCDSNIARHDIVDILSTGRKSHTKMSSSKAKKGMLNQMGIFENCKPCENIRFSQLSIFFLRLLKCNCPTLALCTPCSDTPIILFVVYRSPCILPTTNPTARKNLTLRHPTPMTLRIRLIRYAYTLGWGPNSKAIRLWNGPQTSPDHHYKIQSG